MTPRLPAALLAMLATAAAAGPLPIRPGDYAEAGTGCSDAPLAAIARYDGRGLGGPHAARCTTIILSRTGARYRVATTCRANGDGSPAPPSTIRATIRVLSRTRFVMVARGGGTVFRRCPTLR